MQATASLEESDLARSVAEVDRPGTSWNRPLGRVTMP
jgi:hypothetical protein